MVAVVAGARTKGKGEPGAPGKTRSSETDGQWTGWTSSLGSSPSSLEHNSVGQHTEPLVWVWGLGAQRGQQFAW